MPCDNPRESHLLRLLEVHRDEVKSCPGCGGAFLYRWGASRRQLQRLSCRGCGRSFTAATGTPLAHVHSLEKLRDVAVDMLGKAPRSCRTLAAVLGVDRMTVWRWRRLIAAIWAQHIQSPASNQARPERTVLRESRKASREWIDHYRNPASHPAPDRLRWIDYRLLDLPLPEPMSRYRVTVRLPTDTGAIAGEISLAAGHQHNAAMRTAFPGAGASARTRDEGSASGVVSAENFRHFLAPFRGPATRHLQTYTAWFAARICLPIQQQRAMLHTA
jgi:transposase-like protein